MLWRVAASLLAMGAVGGLAACSRDERVSEPRVTQSQSRNYGVSASARIIDDGRPVPKGGGAYKLGSPYRIAGRWYVPREEPGYDRIGLASWYGTDFHGRKTANGEIFDMNALTAAHPTLPLPSYAYVTNPQNGRTILVRINDRGPYAHDRVLDLSRQSARMLGTEARGVAQVRVRYAGHAPLDGSDERERRFLVAQQWYSGERYASAAPLSTPGHSSSRAAQSGWQQPTFRAGATAGGAPLAAPGADRDARRFVHVGVFRDSGNVARVEADLAAIGPVNVKQHLGAGGTFYRVRLGPFDAAQASLAVHRIAEKGITGAKIVPE